MLCVPHLTYFACTSVSVVVFYVVVVAVAVCSILLLPASLILSFIILVSVCLWIYQNVKYHKKFKNYMKIQ